MTTSASDALDLATGNARYLLAALARTRGHGLVERPGFTAMTGPALVRVLVLRPEPDADDLAAIARLITTAPGEAMVEDPYGTVDAGAWGLVPQQLPVMFRPPSPLPEPHLEVTPVGTPDQLAVAERVVVDGFPLPGFAYGEAFTPALLDHDGMRLFLVRRDGEVAGACLSVVDNGIGGLYWVTTLPAHRSQGVGRALMHGVLNSEGVPCTLSSAQAGKALYDSLGFETVASATWWLRPDS
ncbi:GNAT family N-acetyltransferase [Actinosynnema sp. NPDC050436]|uniref:GNAT family N-acetyltransferase n=1 Tax=Actinosynnema sp. NPDC050436 TaxID=3155659 RepID=UPI0034098DE5